VSTEGDRSYRNNEPEKNEAKETFKGIMIVDRGFGQNEDCCKHLAL
jgi:hypothetical protein